MQKGIQMKNQNTSIKTQTLAGLAILTAIVVVLQLAGSFIRFGTFSISLVLVPIVVGAALYGPWAGCWLGFIFGLVVVLQPDTSFFMNYSPVATVVLCLLKGALAGLGSGFVYRLLEKRNHFAAVLTAAIVCPVVNSGLFFIGCALFFIPLMLAMASGGANANLMASTLLSQYGRAHYAKVWSVLFTGCSLIRNLCYLLIGTIATMTGTYARVYFFWGVISAFSLVLIIFSNYKYREPRV